MEFRSPFTYRLAIYKCWCFWGTLIVFRTTCTDIHASSRACVARNESATEQSLGAFCTLLTMIKLIVTCTSDDIALEWIYRLIVNLNGIPYLLAHLSYVDNTSMFSSKLVKVDYGYYSIGVEF